MPFYYKTKRANRKERKGFAKIRKELQIVNDPSNTILQTQDIEIH